MENYNNTKGNKSEDNLMEDNKENGNPNSQTKAGNKIAQVKKKIVQEDEKVIIKEMQRRIKEMQRRIKELKEENKELVQKKKFNKSLVTIILKNLQEQNQIFREKNVDRYNQLESQNLESIKTVSFQERTHIDHATFCELFELFQTSNPSKDSPAYKLATYCKRPFYMNHTGCNILVYSGIFHAKYNRMFNDGVNLIHQYHMEHAKEDLKKKKCYSSIGDGIFAIECEQITIIEGREIELDFNYWIPIGSMIEHGMGNAQYVDIAPKLKVESKTIQSILNSVNLLKRMDHTHMGHPNLVLLHDRQTGKVIYIHLSFHRFIEYRIEYCSIFEKENPSVYDLARVFDTLHKTNLFIVENRHSFCKTFTYPSKKVFFSQNLNEKGENECVTKWYTADDLITNSNKSSATNSKTSNSSSNTTSEREKENKTPKQTPDPNLPPFKVNPNAYEILNYKNLKEIYPNHQNLPDPKVRIIWNEEKTKCCVRYNFIKGSHLPSMVCHLINGFKFLLNMHEKGHYHADVRFWNMIFREDGIVIFIDFDYVGNSVYPPHYNTDLSDARRHPEAKSNMPIKWYHDIFSFVEIFKNNYVLKRDGDVDGKKKSEVLAHFFEKILSYVDDHTQHDDTYIEEIRRAITKLEKRIDGNTKLKRKSISHEGNQI